MGRPIMYALRNTLRREPSRVRNSIRATVGEAELLVELLETHPCPRCFQGDAGED
jgi:hypothetical protein